MTAPGLIADIGGTNARFALVPGPGAAPERVEVLKLADHPTFLSALDAYLGGAPVAAAAIDAAGPVGDGEVALTNAPWVIGEAEVSAHLGGAPVRVFNDLEAVALSLPLFGPGDGAVIAPGAPAGRPLPQIAVNVGTGFGASVAVPVAGGWTALATEAGHVTLEDAAPFAAGAVTVEDVFSGPAYARLFGGGGDAARRRDWSGLLGRVAANLTLGAGAWGGVWLCGGLMQDFDRLVDQGAFLDAFTGATPMKHRLARVPIRRVTHPVPAFPGLVAALDWSGG